MSKRSSRYLSSTNGGIMKLITLLTVFLFATGALAEMRVLMMMPNDFMWPEYAEPRRVYEAAGFKVTTASKSRDLVNPDARNKLSHPESTKIKTDLTFDEVNINNFDAITFVAGNGAWHYFFPDQKVHDIVSATLKSNKVLGLLCSSTGLLGLVDNWDGSTPIAKNRKVVGYFRVEGILRQSGKVNFVSGGKNEPTAVTDGNLITGRNPESATIFAEAIVKALGKR